MGRGFRRSFARAVIAAGLLAAAAGVGAPESAAQPARDTIVLPTTGIRIDTAAIRSGRLLLDGRTREPRTAVTLDGQFVATSDNLCSRPPRSPSAALAASRTARQAEPAC
jgi:hypothetical protein